MAKKGGGAVTQPFQNNSTSSFNNTGTTSNNFNNTSTGTTTGTGSGSSNSQVTTPTGWTDAWRGFQPGAGGFNPTQQSGVNWLGGALGGIDPNQARGNLNLASDYFGDTLLNRTAPTLANLAASGNPAYAAPANVSAQMIAAKRGSELMGDYQNPYQSQVIDASLNQYDQDSAEARNGLRANNAGAFGNKRYGVAEGQFAADSALGRAGLGANLRSQGFNTAAGLGMQDANRYLSADTTNASNKLAADTFNANMANQRQQFDANLGMQYNDQRDRVGTTLANLGNSDYAIGQGLANGMVNAGGMGNNQNLAWLGAAVPSFGTSNNFSNTQTGTQTGSQSGSESGTTTNSGTGTGSSSGYQTGINQSGGKGGIIGSLGSLATGLAPFAGPIGAGISALGGAVSPINATAMLADVNRRMG